MQVSSREGYEEAMRVCIVWFLGENKDGEGGKESISMLACVPSLPHSLLFPFFFFLMLLCLTHTLCLFGRALHPK